MNSSDNRRSSRRENRRRKEYVCVRRKRVVKLVIERYDGLSRNQAELGRKVVRLAFRGRANSLTLYILIIEL